MFDDLNKVEDEYAVQQEVIKNFRSAITLNKTELLALKKKMEGSEKEKEDLEQVSSSLQKELDKKK